MTRERRRSVDSGSSISDDERGRGGDGGRHLQQWAVEQPPPFPGAPPAYPAQQHNPPSFPTPDHVSPSPHAQFGPSGWQIPGGVPSPGTGTADEYPRDLKKDPSAEPGEKGLHLPHGLNPFHHTPPPPPPSGFRVPLSTDAPFPAQVQTGNAPFHDLDGSPVYIGSALFDRSVHPCKIAPHLNPAAMVPYAGTEHGHHGRYDLLPFVPESMEWVPTNGGLIPPGRRPIEGGYEENGAQLYHACAEVSGVRVPGKTAEHLGGANIGFGGSEHIVHNNYHVLCWK